MLRLGDISIERKLKWITMLASGVALTIACIGIVCYDFFSYRAQMRRDLDTLAEVTAINCELPLSLDYKKDAAGYLAALEAEPHILAACIYRTNAVEFVRYVRPGHVFNTPEIQKASHIFSRNRLQLFHPIMREGETVGTLYLVSDLNQLHARLRTYAMSVVFLAALALTVAFVLSSRLQRMISRPLLHLSETAKTVSQEKNFALRADKHGNDELGTLIDGFNEMLTQIQQRDTALRTAHDDLERRVTERTKELRQEVADRKQAEKVVQQQLTRISLLNQITHAISERQDVQSILSIVLQQLQNHLPVMCGAFYLFDAEENVLRLAAVRGGPLKGETPCLFSMSVPLAAFERGPLANCLRSQTSFPSRTMQMQLPLLQGEFATPEIQSFVVVPLHVENKLFGLLVTGRAAENAFSSGECEFLKMLGEQVALAGHQAQLYTQLQSAYNELRETQQAVMQHERLRALGQMASGIAHDINNALSPVLGFAELLLLSEPNLSANGRKYIQHIRTSSEDITHIVARLREFYRRRDDTHQMKAINLNQVAAQVIELTRPRWKDMSQERGVSIQVQTRFSPTIPPVMAIESEVREALTNLILNAVDALKNEGAIVIHTSVTAPAAGTNSPSEVVLEVEDDGVGMDQETRKRCLEPFFSTKGVRGTGLGLAMVYGIMERHEGRIEIVSERGEGTRMKLIFPVVASRPAPSELPPLVQEPLPPLHILFVDDEPLLRQLVRELLEHDSHTVAVADSGQNALEQFRAASGSAEVFDVVITDLGMPQLDGRRLAELLKKESPQTPIIMLTGWGTLMRSDDEKLAVDFILSKPPKIQEMREALRTVLRRTPSTAAH
jgi:signal transduction histidine kinase/ActR/RegA family two-component response regulator